MTENLESCGYNDNRRVRYFHGMLLSDRDFREEQIYHSGMRHLINRSVFGWGVVCGFDVKKDIDGGANIIVDAGVALDSHGREIVVTSPQRIDLKPAICESLAQNDIPCNEEANDEQKTFYIVIKYHEREETPVPVYAPGAGCDDKTCEFSRIKQGYCIDVTTECPNIDPTPDTGVIPALYELGDNQPGVTENTNSKDCIESSTSPQLENFCNEVLKCEPCAPKEHFIGLASVTVNLKSKTIVSICVNDCRTYVVSPRMIQSLIKSTLTGIENINATGDYQSDNTNRRFYSNPIVLVCWLIKQKFIDCLTWPMPKWCKGTTPTPTNDPQKPSPTPSPTPQEKKNQENQITQLKNEIKTMQEQMSDLMKVVTEKELTDTKSAVKPIKKK